MKEINSKEVCDILNEIMTTIDSIPDNITSWFNYKGLTFVIA